MRELDRHAAEHTRATLHPADPGGSRTGLERVPALRSLALVGRGRVGTALALALDADAQLTVLGPFGRGDDPRADIGNGVAPPDAVLLCVPDEEIVGAAHRVAGISPLVGHTSGATPLSALEPARRAGAELFGLHPLQTLAGADSAAGLAGAGCAIAGTTAAALGAARDLAERLDLEPFEIAEEHRAVYHAAACTASNFLVTLQDAAEALARGAGMTATDARRALVPLVRATVENWASLGPEAALTGPVARGDEATITAQRTAIRREQPGLLPLFEALVERTRHVAARQEGTAAASQTGATP